MKIALLLLVLLGMQEAQANEAEFVKTKEGCSVMLEVITIVDSVSWSGKCVDGRIEGVGIATYVKGNKKISFIEEYMGGVRAYPYIVDKSGAIRLSGGTEARYVTMELCKKLDECSALYDYAVKSKRLASLDNRIGKDIEGFGRDTSLSVIGGGKVVYTQYPQGGYSFDFDYSGVQATAAPPSHRRRVPWLQAEVPRASLHLICLLLVSVPITGSAGIRLCTTKMAKTHRSSFQATTPAPMVLCTPFPTT